MINRFIFLLILFLIVACKPEEAGESGQSGTAQERVSTHILVHNGIIYTMDRGFSTADSMVFNTDGEIQFVGNVEPMREMFPHARQIDLHGKTIIPGLIDSHGHLYGLAVSLTQAQLRDTTSKADVIRNLREHEAVLPAGEWLVGRGWDQNDWPVQEFPTREDLDKQFPDRPVWLRRIDGHAGWANSAALAMADQDLSGDWQPKGGYIYRDADGQATGVLVDGAMSLVQKAVPDISPDLLQGALDLALQQMLSLGLTGVHDPGISRQILEIFQQRIKNT